MDADNLRLKSVRRRMRGLASFFIVIASLTLLGTMALWLLGRAELSQEDLIGRLILGVGLFFGAVGAWHGSRVAAGTVFGTLLLTPVLASLGATTMTSIDWIRAALYIGMAGYMLWNAIRYHRVVTQTAVPLGGAGPVRWVSKLVSVSVAAFLAFGLTAFSIGTPISVIRGSEISNDDLSWLAEQGFLFENERPLYLYMDGAFSIDEGGSLLTDQYAGGWWKTQEGIESVWIRLGQICEIKPLENGSFFQDAVYSIHDAGDQNSIQLWLSIEGGMHKRFISRMTALNKRKMRPEVREFCDKGVPIDWDYIATQNGISQDIIGAAEVSEQHRNWLLEKEYLLEGEEIIQFHSYGNFEISEGGSLLTDQYIGGWYILNYEPQTWWSKLEDVCDISEDKSGASQTLTFIRITSSDGDWIKLNLPAQSGQAQAFADKALELITSAQTEEHLAACDAMEAGETADTTSPP